MKSYCRFNLLRVSSFNVELLDILRFQYATSFSFQFRASRYIMGLNQTSELKVIIVWICSEVLFSILSVSIYYVTQSDIQVKSYNRLNFLRACFFYFERLEILRDLIRHLSNNLLSLEFAQSFFFQVRASRYIAVSIC